MILSAPLPWFGSKRTLAPEIVKHFGPHDTYYEPFCGSCAVLFAKSPSRLEVASDKHSDVINLLKCLREEKQDRAIWEFVERMPVSETMFAEAAERMKSPIEDEYYCDQFRAIDFLVVSWQGPSGLAGTKNKPRFAKRNTASGGSTAARWRNVGQSIPAWHERLRNVELTRQHRRNLIHTQIQRLNLFRRRLRETGQPIIPSDPVSQQQQVIRRRGDWPSNFLGFVADPLALSIPNCFPISPNAIGVRLFSHPSQASRCLSYCLRCEFVQFLQLEKRCMVARVITPPALDNSFRLRRLCCSRNKILFHVKLHGWKQVCKVDTGEDVSAADRYAESIQLKWRSIDCQCQAHGTHRIESQTLSDHRQYELATVRPERHRGQDWGVVWHRGEDAESTRSMRE